MSQVWHTGSPDVRTITSADWTRVGVSAQAQVTWDRNNNWSVNQNLLNAAALTWLGTQPDFQLVGTDTYPTKSTFASSPATPGTVSICPMRAVTSTTTALAGECVLAGGTGGYSVPLGTGVNGSKFRVLNNGSGVVTVTIPTGTTLKGLADNAGSTVTQGLNGTVALAANAVAEFLTDGTNYWVV